MEISDLKILAIKNILEGLTSNDIINVFKDMDKFSLILIKKYIDKQAKKYLQHLFIITYSYNDYIKPNPHVNYFIKKYRGNNLELFRHDPVLIITSILFLTEINLEYNISKNFLDPFKKYKIITESSNMWFWNFFEEVIIEDSDIFALEIPERPVNLFADIQQYSQENDIELNFYDINEYPTVGPYRIHD